MNRDWRRIGKSSKFVPPDALKEHSLALPVPRIPSLHYKILLFVEDLKKNSYIHIKNLYGYEVMRTTTRSKQKRCSK